MTAGEIEQLADQIADSAQADIEQALKTGLAKGVAAEMLVSIRVRNPDSHDIALRLVRSVPQ